MKMEPSAVILAGGKAQRMQGDDKGLILLQGSPLILHVIERLKPQLNNILISANRNIDEYKKFGLPVLTDNTQGFMGPLAGIASAMDHCETDYLLTIPCDCPFIPDDLVTRMLGCIKNNNADLCLAHDGQRLQPLIALISSSLSGNLANAIKAGHLKAERWMLEQNHCIAEFDDGRHFININSPDDLAAAQVMLKTNRPQPT